MCPLIWTRVPTASQQKYWYPEIPMIFYNAIWIKFSRDTIQIVQYLFKTTGRYSWKISPEGISDGYDLHFTVCGGDVDLLTGRHCRSRSRFNHNHVLIQDTWRKLGSLMLIFLHWKILVQSKHTRALTVSNYLHLYLLELTITTRYIYYKLSMTLSAWKIDQ